MPVGLPWVWGHLAQTLIDVAALCAYVVVGSIVLANVVGYGSQLRSFRHSSPYHGYSIPENVDFWV